MTLRKKQGIATLLALGFMAVSHFFGMDVVHLAIGFGCGLSIGFSLTSTVGADNAHPA